jgi:hypothetical protein
MGTNNALTKSNLSVLKSALIGTLICLIIIYIIEAIGHFFFPLPKKISSNVLNDIKILENYVSNAPKKAMFFPLSSYILGVSLGSFIANKLSKRILSGILVGLILLLLHIITLSYILHPKWYIYISCSLPIPFSVLGAYFSKLKSTIC